MGGGRERGSRVHVLFFFLFFFFLKRVKKQTNKQKKQKQKKHWIQQCCIPFFISMSPGDKKLFLWLQLFWEWSLWQQPYILSKHRVEIVGCTVKVCVGCVCVLSCPTGSTEDEAADPMMQQQKRRLWHFTADPREHNTLTKTNNAHVFKMPTVTYSHEHSQDVLWSFWVLARSSYTNKLTNKRTGSVCKEVACSVWSAERWISG